MTTKRLETESTAFKLVEFGGNEKNSKSTQMREGYKEDRNGQSKTHKVNGKHKFKYINN